MNIGRLQLLEVALVEADRINLALCAPDRGSKTRKVAIRVNLGKAGRNKALLRWNVGVGHWPGVDTMLEEILANAFVAALQLVALARGQRGELCVVHDGRAVLVGSAGWIHLAISL